MDTPAPAVPAGLCLCQPANWPARSRKRNLARFASGAVRVMVATDIAEFVSRGLGVALLPESVTRAHAGQLHAITLTRPTLRGRIALAWRAEAPAGPAARAFIGHARAQLTRRTKGG